MLPAPTTRKVEPPNAEYTLRDQERMQAASRYFQWQYRMAEHEIARRVLEVGCGVGNVTNLLLEREIVVGIDVEAECVKERRRKFAGRSNIITEHLNVLDKDFLSLRRFNFDSIVCLNVLEHISDDAKALAHMRAVLQPGGRIVLIVPAFESLYGQIDANLGHFRRYSRRHLTALATSVGFEVATAHYMNAIGFAGWWMNARILRRGEQSEPQIRFFDSWIVPVISRVENLIHPPFGQSIFAVLRST